MWLKLQFSVSWLVDFQWGSCGSNFSFLCHGWQTFSGVRVAQSLVFCVMVGKLLVGFVWLNLQFSVSWQEDFQWGSCGSIFSFLCHGWQTFSGVRVAQSLVFCVMVGRLLVGFVWLNLQFSVSWLVDFKWGSFGSIFMFSVSWLVDFWWGSCGSIFMFSVSWLVDFWWGSCGSIFSFLCHGWQTFSGLRVAQTLIFYVMVGRLLVGLLWLNLQFFVSWLVDFQWGSCGSMFSFMCHGRQTFSGVRVAQSLAFCVMVGKFLVGFVQLNLQFFVSWQVDFQWAPCVSILVFCVMVGRFQWGSCCSIFCFLCHGQQTFSGLRMSQSLVFCVMVVRFLVVFVWLSLQFSVSWLVDFQWGSCVSIFSFLCHGSQIFNGVRVAQSLVYCVMVGRLLVGFVWPNLQFSVSWQVDFQWGSCGSIFSFLCHGWQTFIGFVWLNLQFSVSWLVDFQWARVAQSLDFCVMVGRLLVGFVWLNLQFSVSWQVDFQWGSCGSIFSFLCYGWQTFSGVPVAQCFVFCVMVGRLLVGFVCLNLQFSVSWLVEFQWVRVAQSLVFCVIVGRLLAGFVWLNLQFFVSWLVDFQWGSCGSIFSFLCHCRQTFSGVRVAQSLVFCVMVGRIFGGALCGSIFSFLCHGW